MHIVYIDRLSFFSLLSVVCSRIEYSHIFYFDTTSYAERFAKLYAKLGILKVDPKLAKFQLANVRDESGECQFFKLIGEINKICSKISDKEFVNSIFLRKVSRYFDFRKLLLFFEKLLARELSDTITFINVARWHARYKVNFTGNSVVFFLEKGLWSKYISEYITERNAKVVEYSSVINSFHLYYYFPHIINKVLSIIKSKFNCLLAWRKRSVVKKEEQNLVLQNVLSNFSILHWYTGKTITFDLKERSDFFWLIRANISGSNVLICFNNSPNEPTFVRLKNNNLRFVIAKNSTVDSNTRDFNMPLWNPTPLYKNTRKKYIKVLIKCYLLCGLLPLVNKLGLFYFVGMAYFIDNFAYWYDFFHSNKIKINVNQNDIGKDTIPMNQAMEENDGVSISYQWSDTDDMPSIMFSRSSNVHFSFGPAYRHPLEEDHSQLDYLIYCGYITDHAFQEVKKDAYKLRKKILNNGAKFIICFFDENSSDDRMSVITNETSARVHKFFIEKLLEDETIGLILKPGFPNTFYQRMSSINNLIEKAIKTGRCIIIDRGSDLKTDTYPTEAAQAADVCVGLLLSGTVILESYLSGTTAVFLDLEKLYSNPIYQWGKGKVVFDNLDALFSGVQKYRESPESIPGFGDLSSWVKDKTPFKDGDASLRIGQYINWLFEKFKEGETRERAMGYANQKYAEFWGEENVVRWH